MTSLDLDAIRSPHQPDYDSFQGCVCGGTYPCTTLGLVDEVVRLRAAITEHHDRTCRERACCEDPFHATRDVELWSVLEDGGGSDV